MRKILCAGLTAALMLLTGCGGNDEPELLPERAASALAEQAEAVADALEAGRCEEARDQAAVLQTEAERLDVNAAERALAVEGARWLAASINCDKPTPTTTPR